MPHLVMGLVEDGYRGACQAYSWVGMCALCVSGHQQYVYDLMAMWVRGLAWSC